MADYQAKKIPIFQGINDIPKAPDSLEGGNISHFYDIYNQLVDDLEEDVNLTNELANDAQGIAESTETFLFNYYNYYIAPNKQYIIFQDHLTTFELGNHNLNSGQTTIGTIPAKGELYKIVASGTINNHSNISFIIGNNTVNFSKYVYYASGAAWWFFDIYSFYGSPFDYQFTQINAGDYLIINTTEALTNINFRLEMNVYSQYTSLPPFFRTYVTTYENVTTTQVDSNFVADVGGIQENGIVQTIVINEITNLYDTSFSVDGGSTFLTITAHNIVNDGYEFTIDIEGGNQVIQGQRLTMITTAQETNRTVTISIYG